MCRKTQGRESLVISMKKLHLLAIAAASALALTGTVVVASAASAHIPSASIECTTDGTIASVNLLYYDSAATVNATLDGGTLYNGTIGDSGSYVYYNNTLDPTIDHTLVVSVNSFDGDQYDFEFNETAASCVTPPPTQVTPEWTYTPPTCDAAGSLVGVDSPNYTWVATGPPSATKIVFTAVGNVVLNPSESPEHNLVQKDPHHPDCFVETTMSAEGFCTPYDEEEAPQGGQYVIDAMGGTDPHSYGSTIDGVYNPSMDFSVGAFEPVNDRSWAEQFQEDSHGGSAQVWTYLKDSEGNLVGDPVAGAIVTTDCGTIKVYAATPWSKDYCSPKFDGGVNDLSLLGGPITIDHVEYSMDSSALVNGVGPVVTTGAPEFNYSVVTLAGQNWVDNGDGTISYTFVVTNEPCLVTPVVPTIEPPTCDSVGKWIMPETQPEGIVVTPSEDGRTQTFSAAENYAIPDGIQTVYRLTDEQYNQKECGETLALTGGDPTRILLTALILLAFGGVALVANSRRRETEQSSK